MRSIFIALYLLLAVALVPELVHSAPCPDICNSKRVWGFGGESTGFGPCECTDPVVGAFRTGPNGCECNVCYKKEGNGKVTAYGPKNGVCRPGETYCDECELSIIGGSDSGSKEPNTTTTAPPTSTPPGSTSSTTPLTPSSPSDASSSTTGNTGAPVSSNSSQSGAGDDAGTGSTDDSTMATWQIALIICSCVLVFAVVVMTIMSCYCKTRKQMKDNDTLEQETREYENYWHPGNSTTAEARAVGGQMGKSLNSSVISAQHTLGGRSSFTSSHSRPNSTKNVPYIEPTFAESDKMGRPAARQSLGSRNDLPPVFNAFPQRPAHELNNRNNVAIEL